jgi:GTP1/Obg family GTP-binding protein
MKVVELESKVREKLSQLKAETPDREAMLKHYQEAVATLIAIDQYIVEETRQDAFWLGEKHTEKSMLETISHMADMLHEGFAPGVRSMCVSPKNLEPCDTEVNEDSQ